jgi:hypothetical protein
VYHEPMLFMVPGAQKWVAQPTFWVPFQIICE